jgi:competence protein ComEC
MGPIPVARRDPLAPAAAALVAGLLVGRPAALALLVLGLVFWGVQWARRRRSGGAGGLAAGLAAVLAGLVLAVARPAGGGAAQEPPWGAGTPLHLAGNAGRVFDPPPGVERRAWFDLQTGSPGGKRNLLRVYLARGEPAPLPGTRLVVSGRFRPPASPRNPGEWNEQAQWRRVGLAGALDVRPRGLEIVAPPPWWHVLAAGERARRWLAAVLSAGIDDPDRRAVVLGISLGLRDGLGDEAVRSFRRTGSLHLFAVSGLHVGLLAGMVWVAAAWAGLGRRAAAWLVLAAVWAQVLVTGCEPPVLRAGLVASVFLLGLAIDRSPRLLNSTAAAILVLLVWEPRQLWDLGFQLTFAVALALILVGAPLARRLAVIGRPDEFLPEDLVTPGQRRTWRVARFATSTLAIGFAANLGSLPLGLWYFNLATPVGILLGFLLIPLAWLVLAVALAAGGLALAGAGGLVLVLNQANATAAGWAIAVCQAGEALPGAWWMVPRPVPGSHQLLVLDLDRGGAAALLRGGGGSWLIDVGNPGEARRVTAAACLHLGVAPPDGWIFTHPDAQHWGGRLDFAAQCGEPPGMLANPAAGAGSAATAGWLEILFPPPGWEARRADDAASVLRLDLAGTVVLWVGDAGFGPQKWMLENVAAGRLRADILCVGWHSADIGLTREFVLAVAPRAVVVHRTRRETPFPPDAALFGFLRERGIEVWDQRETGAVTIDIRPGGTRLSGFLVPPGTGAGGAGGGWSSPGPASGARNQ